MVSRLFSTFDPIWQSSHIEGTSNLNQFIERPTDLMHSLDEDLRQVLSIRSLFLTVHSSIQSHPNIFIFLLLVLFSTYFGLSKCKSQKVSKPDTVLPVLSSSQCPIPAHPSPFSSPMTAASSSDCLSVSNLSFLTALPVLDQLIDNGNFSRYFDQLSTVSESRNLKLISAQHKLDSQQYLIQVQDFDIPHEKVESAVLAQVSKFRSLRFRGLTRYVTCWVEDHSGIVQLYVQLEKVEGQDLRRVTKDRKNGLQASEAVKVVRKVAKVLKFLHNKDLVHGNVTMSSVFLDEFGTVSLGMPRFCGRAQDDLDMFRLLWEDLLAHVRKEQVELAKTLYFEDRFVGQLDIYQLN